MICKAGFLGDDEESANAGRCAPMKTLDEIFPKSPFLLFCAPPRICGGSREDIGMKTCLHGQNGLREKNETVILCRGPGPTRKKKEI